MFERWFKSSQAVPTPLDLGRHRPQDFQGKSVSLNDGDYLIGRKIEQSDQGYSHQLINRRSGLCLHVIQIRPEYAQAPDLAWSAGKGKEEATACLRNQFRKSGDGNVDVIGVVTAWQAHGGSFAVHEIQWGMFDGQATAPALREIAQAGALREAGDHASASECLLGVLRQHPQHTIVLNNLASAYQAQGQYAQAIEAITKAVEIEPNYCSYLGAQVQLAVNGPYPRSALDLFAKLQLRYPHVRDYDLYGIHACLRSGHARRAREILADAPLPETDARLLAVTVERAVSARERLVRLGARVLEPGNDADALAETLRELEDIHQASPDDPHIQANLGFSLRRAGHYERACGLILGAARGLAGGLMPTCLANAAYCLIALSQWNNAFDLLASAMQAIKGSRAVVEPADVPGIATWVMDNNAVLESMQPSAADLIDAAIQSCPDPSLVTPDIQHMVTLLRAFAQPAAG